MPRCNITDNPWQANSSQNKTQLIDGLSQKRERLRVEGYTQLDAVIAPAQLDAVRCCINSLHNAGIRVTYAWVYDEFYSVLQQLLPYIEALIDDTVLIVPDELDAHYIEKNKDSAGSAPHRDGLRFPDSLGKYNKPLLVNAWLALSDATVDNGCIHVLPALHDKAYGKSDEIKSLKLQNIRALPVKAGDLLVWSTHLIHWGGRSSDFAKAGRASLAAYFQAASSRKFHPTAMLPGCDIPFEYRMYLVEKAWKDPKGTELLKYMPNSN